MPCFSRSRSKNGEEGRDEDGDVEVVQKKVSRQETNARSNDRSANGGSKKKQNSEGTIFLPEKQKLLNYVRENVIGEGTQFDGPFGPRNIIYCDYTASGRPLRFLEDYIRDYVYPYYGNTHTTTSVASRQTSRFRDEARDIIKYCVNASSQDVVIFTGNGTTAAIHKLIGGLELRGERAKKTAVLVGPYEHHSNILPWKEVVGKSLRIKETSQGLIDLEDLEKKLKIWSNNGYSCVVSCSAASNVTGILTDTVAVAEIAHKYDAYVIFDYAAAAPYIEIDMNPSATGYKDAVVCSPHKFVGGPGSPGVLIAKKRMFRNPVPDCGGGGTVLFVTRDTHRYIKDIESREEGGTPAIIESIRCGLAFHLKQAIDTVVIEACEEMLCQKAFAFWKKTTNLLILGSQTSVRLPIFSFVVKNPETGKYLHHNFVSVLLNDLFGIQARGGCACAGPYAEDLLGIAETMAQSFAKFLDVDDTTSIDLREPLEVMKPGFCRLNLPFFMDEDTVQYVLEAVDIIAQDGWRLLPQYTFDAHTGSWVHRSLADSGKESQFSLHDIAYGSKGMVLTTKKAKPKSTRVNLQKILKAAQKIITDAKNIETATIAMDPQLESIIRPENHDLIWFVLPAEANKKLLVSEKYPLKRQVSQVPFKPRRLTMLRLSTRITLPSVTRFHSIEEDEEHGIIEVNEATEQQQL